MVVDTRSREEKRRSNLESLRKADPHYAKTISYQKTHAELNPVSPAGSSPQSAPSLGPSGEGAFKGEYGKDKTPFEQLEAQKGEFYEKARMGTQRLEITQQYNAAGLESSLQKKPAEYAEAYRKASEEAVAKRIEARNVQMLQQSALGDMLQSGFFVSARDAEGREYIAVSEKGKNLGYSTLYGIEDKAVWGGSFDFFFENDVVYMYPEGTRKAISGAGMGKPVILQKNGAEFLVVQGSGKDTIGVMEFDPLKNALKGRENRQITEFLDLSDYDVQPDATFTYSMSGSGFDIDALGVVKKGASPLSAPPQQMRNIENKISGEDILISREMLLDFEAPANFTPRDTVRYNKWGEPYVPGTQSELEFADITPTRQFYRTDYSEEYVGTPFRNLQERYNLPRVSVPFVGEIGGAQVAGFIADMPEFYAKGIMSVGSLTGSFIRAKLAKTPQERIIAQGDFYAAMPEIVNLPVITAFSAAEMLGASQKVQALDKASGKAINPMPESSRIVSTRIEGGYVSRDYMRGGSVIFTDNIPKGHPQYFSARIAAPIQKAGQTIGSIPSKLMDLPGRAIIGAVESGGEFVQSQKTMYFLAHGERTALKQISYSASEAAIPAYLTAKGMNFYGMVKPKPPIEQAPVPQPMPRTSTFTAPQPRAPVRERERFIVKSSVRSPPRVLPVPQFRPSQSERSRENIREAINQDIRTRDMARVRDVVSPRSNIRLNVGVLPRQKVSELEKIGEGIRFSEIPRTRVPQRIRIGERMRQTIKPPQPKLVLPAFKFGYSDGAMRSTPMMRQPRTKKTAYSPSLAGIALGKIEKSPRKVYSGFEIRGIKRGRKRGRMIGVL